MILDCWLPIATVAWEGFLQHGRGVVYVRTIDGSWHLLYRPGATVRAHRSIVESYDPAKQAIVLVLREEDGPSLHVAEGWPSPPEAIGRTTADEVGETMH